MRRAWLVTAGLGLVLTTGCTFGGSGGKASPASSDPASGDPASTAPPSSAPATGGSAETAADWPQYHGNPERTGVSTTMPAASGRLTATKIKLDGQVYASPIIVRGTVIVATEHNMVYGLDETGHQRWRVSLGTPTPQSKLPCGNIDPLGITGTPIYDSTSDSIFLVASTGDRVSHQLYALNPVTGQTRWHRAIDLPGADPQAMQQRGALAIAQGRVWVPFGGLAGDCGNYKGRLVGVPLTNGEPIAYTVPTTREGGIWTPPGPTVLNGDLLVAVGNGESTGSAYDFSDSVLRVRDGRLVDSFSPTGWAPDNASDLDLGSQGPALVQGKWIFQAGKSGTGYVLNADRLGGIGGQVWQGEICRSFGGTAVSGDTVYVPCTDGVRAVRIDGTGQASVRWHAPEEVTGSPVVGGGRVYAADPDGGVLIALDPATGQRRETVNVGELSRFATPAISGSRLYLPTLSGLAIVETA